MSVKYLLSIFHHKNLIRSHKKPFSFDGKGFFFKIP
jgi:hypothetical protein